MTFRRLIFAKIHFLKYKLWHILRGFILPGDDTLAILSGLITRLPVSLTLIEFMVEKKISMQNSSNQYNTAWKVPKYGFFSGSYSPVFDPEKTQYLDTFHAV